MRGVAHVVLQFVSHRQAIRFLLHIPRGTIKVALYVLFFGTLLFFGLTRTTVGREEVRREIEDRFRSRFGGSVQIGRLSGNLVYSFLAENVSLFDPDGSLIGHIDTVRAEPSWESLISRELKFNSIELRGVLFDLRRDEMNRWNVVEAIRPKTETIDSVKTPFSLIAPNIRLTRASLTLRNRGSVPELVQNGTVADYLNDTVIITDARFVLDWEGATRQLDVVNLTGMIPSADVSVIKLQSQVVWENSVVFVNELSLTTTESRIEFTGSYDSGVSGENGLRAHAFDADLRASPLSSRELNRFVPIIPARDAMVVETHVSGDRNSIVLNNASLARGKSAVQAAGVFDLRNDSLLSDLGISSPHLSVSDFDAVFPSVGIRRYTSVDSARGEIWIQSRSLLSDLSNVRADIQADIESSAGSISSSGTVSLVDGRPKSYSATAAIADVDLSALSAGRLLQSTLSGNVELQGRGRSPTTLSGKIAVALGRSTIAGFNVDTLTSVVTAADARWRLDGNVRQTNGGRANVDASYTLAEIAPTFEAKITGTNLNLFASEPLGLRRSTLNGRVDFSGSGNSLADLAATVSVSADSSSFSLDDVRSAELPPFLGRVELVQDAQRGAQITLSGAPLSGTFESGLTLDRLVETSQRWQDRIANHLSTVTNKRYSERGRAVVLVDSIVVIESNAVTSRDDPDTRIAYDLTVTDPAVIASVFSRKAAAVGLTIQGSGTVSYSRLLVSSIVRADSLSIDSFTAELMNSSFTLQASTSPSISRSLSLDASARFATASIGAQTLISPVVSIRHREGTGAYRLQSAKGERVGPIDVRAQLTTLGPSNRLIVDAARLVAGDYQIGVNAPNYIDFYADAVVARDFELYSSASDGRRQRLEIDGTYSSEPTDTLYVLSENIELQQLSHFLALKKPIGGILNGQAVVTKRDNLSVVSGEAGVSALSLGPRVLGDLELTARLRPGTSEVVLDAEIRPVSESVPLQDDQIVVENSIAAKGTVGFSDRTLGPALNLQVEIDRADLFFFEYIFPHTIENVRGLVRGTGTVTGNWFKPRFDADLAILQGSFAVPDFELAYGIEGELTVDDSGVHIGEGRLRDATGGSALLSGSVLFNRFRYFSLDLGGRFRDLQVMNVDQSNNLPFFGHIWASGDVTLSGPISEASLRSVNAETTASSILNIPLVAGTGASDAAFIVFADSLGMLTDDSSQRTRQNVLDRRPVGERTFLDGLDIDLNLFGPQGSTVNLVIDPLVGDVMKSVGTGRVQVIRREGEFTTFGTFEVNSGDYLFTAGDVFVRRFDIDSGGSLTWDGSPTNAILNIPASYKTRASSAGLPGVESQVGTIPLVVRLQITGRVASPEVALSLEVDRTNRNVSGSYQALEAILNQPARATEYATSVLVTNSFLLTTSDANSTALASSAFNSVSQLVASQINRYLNEALPNVDFSFGVQGESAQELGVTYGIALRLLDERLVIRGQGVYQGTRADALETANGQGLEGEFVVELRLNKSVSVEAFYRREGDVLTEAAITTGSTGAGVSYQTEFSSWRRFFRRLFGTDKAESRPTASSENN